MLHTVKDYTHLRTGPAGLSAAQIDQHARVYAGLVGKLNEIEQKLAHADRGASSAVYNDYSEIKRRETVALNGALLHELYFESLGTTPMADPSPLAAALEKGFGSYVAWERDFRAAATSTNGWVLLTLSHIDGLLHNYTVAEYEGLPAAQKVVLAADCWEHAYMIDFGTGKQDYLTAFFKHANWGVAEARFLAATPVAPPN